MAKYKKGDFVIVDEDGRPLKFEITGSLNSAKRSKWTKGELYYEAREVNSGVSRTVSEDEILRLATPVDNSAELFSRSSKADKI